jgi:hypothetical protein
MFKELPKVFLFVVIISYFFDMSIVNSLDKRLSALEQEVEILQLKINQDLKEEILLGP